MKQFMKKTGLALLLASITTITAWADDVEIYFNTSAVTDAGAPLVMFSLDYRPNVIRAHECWVFGDCPWDDYWDGTLTPADTDYNEIMAAYAQALIDNGAVSDPPVAGDEIDFLEMLQGALRVVLDRTTGIKVGLMLNHDHINNCEGPGEENTDGCSNGGYIAMGFQAVDGTDTATGGDDVLISKLIAVPASDDGNDANPFQGRELYFEFFRYLTGQGIYNGHVGHVDYGDTCAKDNLDETPDVEPSCGVDDKDVDPLLSWDTDIENDPDHDTYVSPFNDAGTECSGVYALNFMFGVTNSGADSDDAITAAKASGGMDGIDISGNKKNFGTVINWMYEDSTGSPRDLADGTWGGAPDRIGDQNVTSYFMYKGNLQNTVNGYAIAGGTNQGYEITDPAQLVVDIENIFEQIKRQNSTFEAPAVTVNSYSRLTHRDELYYALFAPEETADWPGNLKKYKLRELPYDSDDDGINDTVAVQIADQNDVAAVEEQSELFLSTACSYWTDCSVDRSDPADGEADPDGDIITWGGAAEMLTGATRNIYTDTGTSNNLTHTSNELHEDNTAITAYMLGVTSATIATDIADPIGTWDDADIAAQRERLLQLGRGVDPTDTSVALQTMGDPIHSRPSVIEYDGDIAGEGANPDLAIAMTTNEGVFHLINESDGTEYFAYMPQELLPLIGQINGPTYVTDNDPEGPNRFRTYGLDASPIVWPIDNNQDGDIEVADGDSVWVFLSQRRGGRNIYALDVTNRNAPTLKWKIQGGVTAGFDELGQTWSEPVKVVIMVDGDPTPALIFGGGYDNGQDSAYSLTDTVGRAIYVVNADTGAPIWTISSQGSPTLTISEMESSFPSKLRVIDLNNDYILDRLYAVDVVGRVFRIDFDTSTDTDNTAIYGGGMVAALNDPTCVQDAPDADGAVLDDCQRRFFNAPDIALQVGYPVSPFLQISVGSGYRPFPVTVTGIQNRFYTLFDTNVMDPIATADYATKYHWTESSNLADVSTIPDGTVTYATATSNAQALLLAADKHGWYFNLDTSLNEHALSESVTLQGYTFFTTYLRDSSQADPCSVDLGQGRLYIVNAFNGLPVADLFGTGELLGDADIPTTTDRYLNLDRTGIPSDPLVVFRENSDGQIDPTLVVGSDLPLTGSGSGILGTNPYKKKWWIDVD